MAKKKASAYMSGGEKIAGVIFFAVYLLLPLVTAPLFRVAGNLLGVTIRPALQSLIYYYVLFGVTVVIFHSFLGRTCRNLADNLGSAMLFALLHVWQFAVVQQDLAGFVVLLQYLVPGLVLAWCYDRTGTLWTAIGVHAAANALAVWTVH